MSIFSETYLGFYLIEICKILLTKKKIPMGLVRKEYVHIYKNQKIPIEEFIIDLNIINIDNKE